MESVLIFLAVLLAWLILIRCLNFKVSFFPKSLNHSIRWLHAMTFETLFFFIGFLLRPFGYLENQKKFTGTASGRPILLIHGYLHDSSAWVYIKRKLSSEGLGPIYTLNLHHPFRSIRTYAEFVREKAEEIAQETGRKDLVLIGHSMGGLVSAWYATKLAPAKTVTDVITLGSPLGGTYVAYLALGPNGKEMRPRASFIEELKEAIEKNKTIRFYHVGTKTDQLVVPSSSCWVGHRIDRQLVVDDIGHVGLLFSRRVLKQICEWLYTGHDSRIGRSID